MDRDQVTELQYITPISNLASILEVGVLCHARATVVGHASIADEDVQDRRAATRVPGGLPLHGYANLYFNARNAMIYRRKELHAELAVISVNSRVLDIQDVVIADRNAAAAAVRFGTVEELLGQLDFDRIHAMDWNHVDGWEKLSHKQAMCAEVLIPGVVMPDAIQRAYTSSEATRQLCISKFAGFEFVSNPQLFFLAAQ